MNPKKKYILTSVVTDLLLLAIALSSFSYFHHVKRMTNEEDGGIIAPVNTGVPSENEDGESIGDGGDEIVHEVTDFSRTLPEGTFLPEGEVEKGGGYYKSHDINLTVKEVFEPRDEYYAYYFVYDVYVRNIENLFTVSSKTRVHFTELVEAAGSPIAAVSGDFWGNSASVTVRNGEVIRTGDNIEGDICVLYRDGTMEIVSPNEYHDGYFDGRDVYQVWDFGPSLLKDNGDAFGEGDFEAYSDITSRNPRSSIGYYEPGHYVFIVAEGRRDVTYGDVTEYCKGIRMHDFADIYEELGVKLAYNLDGGDSAFAYYDGEILREDYERAVDPEDEPRKIYDIICVGEVAE